MIAFDADGRRSVDGEEEEAEDDDADAGFVMPVVFACDSARMALILAFESNDVAEEYAPRARRPLAFAECGSSSLTSSLDVSSSRRRSGEECRLRLLFRRADDDDADEALRPGEGDEEIEGGE